jgi:uncharacterized damage-inducible protein DinB
MNFASLLLQRHHVLHSYWLDDYVRCIPADELRVRPHPRVNAIAWSLWHVARVEDAGINRFVADQPQLLDADWMRRMQVDLRHHGSGMTFAEVDDLSRRIDLDALHAYRQAVAERTRAVIADLHRFDLDATVPTDQLRAILFDEGVAHQAAQALFDNYKDWTKGRYLMAYAVSHGFEHVGEIGVIAALLGKTLD